jgi:CRISPR/Cas system CSM-associated protein Csm3 (group 7 of RAMP superfamily)
MNERQSVDPYYFVQLVGEPELKEGTPHHSFEGESGILTCHLTTQTPLFVYNPHFARRKGSGHEEAKFPVRRGEAIIPGSSLKGVIRSVAEAIEPSCLTLFTGTYSGSGITEGKVLVAQAPPGYERCSDVNRLCPACRLFGALRGGAVFTGKVSISDAVAKPGDYDLTGDVVLDVLHNPKPEGRPRTYTQSDGKTIRGRKFYRHRLDGIQTRMGEQKDRHNKTVQPVDAGAAFTFSVEYNNLRPEELRLLLYALVLEPGLWHKIGMGKPLGLGSAHIEVTEWVKIDRKARYQKLGGGLDAPLSGDALQAAIDEQVADYRNSKAANLEDLREVWRYDHNYEVRYQTSYQP